MKKALFLIAICVVSFGCSKKSSNNNVSPSSNNTTTGTGGNSTSTPVTKYGKIQLLNNSTNPYTIYVNGSSIGLLDGRISMTISKEVGLYSVRVLQYSGYVFYPTDKTYNATVTENSTAIISFP